MRYEFWLALLSYYIYRQLQVVQPGDWIPQNLATLSRLLDFIPHNYTISPEISATNTSRIIYVTNHCLSGLDVPLVIAAIYAKTGVLPRALAHRFHFNMPNRYLHGAFMRYFGVVVGSPSVCDELMTRGFPILVFPGGGREVLRRKDDDPYSLFWGERTGFARMAIKHNYTIVPVASIGISEMLKILYDVPAARAMKFLGEKRVETLPLMIPQRLQRMYVSIGAPISTLHYNGEWEGKDGKENQVELRNRTRGALLELIDETRKVQAKDPKRYHIFSRG